MLHAFHSAVPDNLVSGQIGPNAWNAEHVLSIVSMSTSGPIPTTCDTVLASGNITVTLPDATGIAGQSFFIKNVGVGTITIATTAAQTIDGSATIAISAANGTLAVFSNGSNWDIANIATGGGGSGTVNSGTIHHVAIYAASGTAVSSDSTLTDDGTTLTYSGSGGISGIIAANVPSLAASKITSGTIGLAQGGTNVDLSASGATTYFLAQNGSHVVSARAIVIGDLFSADGATTTKFLSEAGTWLTPAGSGSGTVTSVSFTGDGILFTASAGTPVTASGTLTPSLIAITKNRFLAGPSGGGAKSPLTFTTNKTTEASTVFVASQGNWGSNLPHQSPSKQVRLS